MSKQQIDHQHRLGLAVAAATLGMTMGIQPSETFATPSQAEPTPNTSATQTPEPMRLAAVFAKYDGVDGESAKATQGPIQKPGAEFHKVEPAAVGYPGAAYPKVEQPAAGRPGAAYPKVEMPGAAMPK